MLDAEGRVIAAALHEVFQRGVDAPLDDAAFDALARRVFAYQFERNQPYAAYCRRRGITPANVEHWTRIPAVPTAAFKHLVLACGPTDAAEAVFRTSGTTLGAERRGQHYILDLSIYHAALLPNFAAHLLPDGATLPMLALVLSPDDAPDSSLGHMIHVVMERLGAPGSGYFVDARTGIREDELDRALEHAIENDTPVCLLGTAFAFVHWLDRLRERGRRYALPPGSRLMDTGGFKGRSREVPAEELRATYAEWLGIPDDHCVNEYGMTELGSQFYDTVLRDRVATGKAGPRRKVAPPWVRTRVVSAETLEPVAPGEVGLLCHYDLANLGSVLAVQTEDLGRETEDDGFVVLGRAGGAPPRGCSIAMDLLLEAAREGRR
ncbi:MAG TPA: hypothetical protein VIL18_02675 [Longimicrobiales bacterium]